MASCSCSMADSNLRADISKTGSSDYINMSFKFLIWYQMLTNAQGICTLHCSFILLILLTRRWLHKCLVTIESITMSTWPQLSIASLEFFGEKCFTSNTIIIMINYIIITITLSTFVIVMKFFFFFWKFKEQVRSGRLTDFLVTKHLWRYLCKQN